MTPAAHVTAHGNDIPYGGYWNLYIGEIFIARTNNPNQADLYKRIAGAWNNA